MWPFLPYKTGSLTKSARFLPPSKNGGCLTKYSLPSDLVAKALAGDDGNLLRDTLVGIEVESEAGVVLLDNEASGLLDGLSANATPILN
jgi:hypothetical protein